MLLLRPQASRGEKLWLQARQQVRENRVVSREGEPVSYGAALTRATSSRSTPWADCDNPVFISRRCSSAVDVV